MFRGAGYVSRGSRFLLDHRRLWPWATAPLCITLVIFAIGIWVAFATFDDLIGAITPSGFLARALAAILYLLVALSLGFVMYFSFFAVASLLSAPFLELLSELVEEEVTGKKAPPFSLKRLGAELWRGLGHQSRRILLYLSTMAGLFLVGLVVPVLGWLAYAVGSAIVTARFFAYDSLDATMARLGWSYRQKKSFLAQHSALSFGLGGGIALLLAVPVLNAMALSIGSVGGTLLFLDLTKGKPRS